MDDIYTEKMPLHYLAKLSDQTAGNRPEADVI
jgi:hypothetical protein